MRVAWHPSRWWNWCFPEDEKKETVKLWAWAFFVSGDQIQFFFGLKELSIMMSSLLNVFNGRSKSEEFIEVLVDNKEQNWFKRAHI